MTYSLEFFLGVANKGLNSLSFFLNKMIINLQFSRRKILDHQFAVVLEAYQFQDQYQDHLNMKKRLNFFQNNHKFRLSKIYAHLPSSPLGPEPAPFFLFQK